MAKMVDIGNERTRHFGSNGLGDGSIALPVPTASGKPLRFFCRDEALVKHLVALANLDIDMVLMPVQPSSPL